MIVCMYVCNHIVVVDEYADRTDVVVDAKALMLMMLM